MVILACNTASARALHRLQKELTPLPSALPLGRGRKNPALTREGSGRVILGVLIPAAEEAVKFGRVGVLGTAGTVASQSFPKEIKKLNHNAKIFQNSAPMLVPLAEVGEQENAIPFIKKYLKPFANKKIEALVLGCTHYPIFKKQIKLALRSFSGAGEKIRIISQDEIVPAKLKNYLARHPEIASKLSKNRTAKILVTDETETIDELTQKWFGGVKPKLISL